MLGRVVLESLLPLPQGFFDFHWWVRDSNLQPHIVIIYIPKKVSQAGLVPGLTMAVRLQAVPLCMYVRR